MIKVLKKKFTKAIISNFIILLGGRIESISKNIRVKLPEKDEEEVSNDEMEDDVNEISITN